MFATYFDPNAVITATAKRVTYRTTSTVHQNPYDWQNGPSAGTAVRWAEDNLGQFCKLSLLTFDDSGRLPQPLGPIKCTITEVVP